MKFLSLNYGQEDSAIIKKLDQRNETPSGSKSINPEEEKKWEENEKSNLEESISSSSNSEDELDSDYQPDDYISIRSELKELRNDIKIWMEKLATTLNIIVNYIIQNQIPKSEIPSTEDKEPKPTDVRETKQSNVVIHTVEGYQKVRDKFPFEIFIRSELTNLNSKAQKEYSRVLKIAGNIEPLAYFLFRNLSFVLKTMKSFVSTYKEYLNEYRDTQVSFYQKGFQAE